jgi:hypothetical protein
VVSAPRFRPRPELGNSVPPQILPQGPMSGQLAPSCPNLPGPATRDCLPLGPHREESPQGPQGWAP